MTKLYYQLFYSLEEVGLLEVFCLHYVYQPRICNSHSIRPMHNATPHQLFTEGALHMRMSGLDVVEYLPETEFSKYGVESDDSEDSLNTDSDLEGVPVPNPN